MNRAIRTQVDNKQDDFSYNHGLDCTADPDDRDRTRQEFKDEVDVNTILKRFGVQGAAQRQGFYGEFDYSMGLQDAIIAVEDARDAFNALPIEIRKNFGNMAELMAAIDRGAVVLQKPDEDPKKEEPAVTPPAPKE